MTAVMLFTPSVSWLSEELSHVGSLFSRSCSCQLYQFVWIESSPLPNSTQISFGERSSRGPLPIAEAQAEETRTSLSSHVASIWAYDPCLLGTCISTKWGGERYFILLVGGRIPTQAVRSCLEMVMVLPVFLLYACMCPFVILFAASCFQACYVSLVSILWDFTPGITHTHRSYNILFFFYKQIPFAQLEPISVVFDKKKIPDTNTMILNLIEKEITKILRVCIWPSPPKLNIHN